MGDARQEKPIMRLRLTPSLADELEHGLETSAQDGNAFGSIERDGKAAYLVVTDLANAIYRVTSSRDIDLDNAEVEEPGPSRRKLLAGARALDALAAKIVEEAGGYDALPDDAKEQVRLWGIG